MRLKLFVLVLALLLFSTEFHANKGDKKKMSHLSIATFAGGCFWCLQPAFDATPGVSHTVVGYTGGKTTNPSYAEVSSGRTGHYEAIQLQYDPKIVSYETLITTFWHQIDPTDTEGQFADKGTHYQTAIFYHSKSQEVLAKIAKQKLDKSGQFSKPIATKILPATVFYPAEEEHQKYYQKRTLHYQLYKKGSGRADYIEKTWKK